MTRPQVLLKAWQIPAKKQLGQNFLVDSTTAGRIVALAGAAPDDVILEIGAGLGALTIPLAQSARKVVAVEKDDRLVHLLQTELLCHGLANVEVLVEDIFRVDLAGIAGQQDCQLVIFGNLPYNISSQVLVRVIHERCHIRRCVLMLQKELAQRIACAPGVKAYGRISVMLQYCARIHSLMEVKAQQFFPRPKVASEVVAIDFWPRPPFPAQDENFLFRVIKAAFGQRRKTLRNALAGSELQVASPLAAQVLAQAGIDPIRRAETLSVEEFVRLSDGLQRVLTATAK